MQKEKTLNINPLFKAAREFQNTCEKQKWPFCFIGGLAAIRWGEMRMTQDIDLCLLCGFGKERLYINTLLELFTSRISNAHSFALENRVMVLYAFNGVSVDIALSGLPFEEEMIKRATLFEFAPECSLRTCSADDLIILKAFANRSKDWMDIESIILRQGEKLHQKYIINQLLPLCELKNTPEIIDKLKKTFKSQI